MICIIMDDPQKPNGNCNDCSGNVNVFLHFISIPIELYSIHFQSILYLKETETQYQLIDSFNHKDTSTGWPDGKLITKKIQLLKQMTFKLTITIIDVYDRKGNKLNIYKCCNNIKNYKSLKYIYMNNCNYYTWNINDINVIQNIKNAKKK
eukprot:81603_1